MNDRLNELSFEICQFVLTQVQKKLGMNIGVVVILVEPGEEGAQMQATLNSDMERPDVAEVLLKTAEGIASEAVGTPLGVRPN